MKRSASALWNGDLKEGKGVVSTASGVIKNSQYSFSTRFENGIGTNPEELIAAAHASCYSMACANEISKAGVVVESVETQCTVTFDKTDAGFTVTESHLQVTIKAKGADLAKLEKGANDAKTGCPISRLLNTKIILEAKYIN